MSIWSEHTRSAVLPTSSAAWTCYVLIQRDTTNDTVTAIADKSEYSFTLYIMRNTSITRYQNRWSTRVILDSTYDSGIKTLYWPDSTTTIPAGEGQELINYKATLNNDGTSHTIIMQATCADGAPKDCNVMLTFKTAQRTIVPNTPNVYWLDSDSADDTVTVIWDKEPNALRYRVDYYVKPYKKSKYELRKSVIVFDGQYTLNIVDDVDISTEPGDWYCFYVYAISATGTLSKTPGMTHVIVANNPAKVKVDAVWDWALTYVNTAAGLKKVKRVWINDNGTWICAKE